MVTIKAVNNRPSGLNCKFYPNLQDFKNLEGLAFSNGRASLLVALGNNLSIQKGAILTIDNNVCK